MAYQNRNQISDNRGIERLLESKLVEADRNILFALAFANELSHIADICNRIAEDNIEDVKNIGKVLLANAYNPRLRINGEMSSIELKNDFSCKGPYSAVSVLNYNSERISKMAEHAKKLMVGDDITRFEGLAEVMNRVLLRDLAKLEELKEMLKA